MIRGGGHLQKEIVFSHLLGKNEGSSTQPRKGGSRSTDEKGERVSGKTVFYLQRETACYRQR